MKKQVPVLTADTSRLQNLDNTRLAESPDHLFIQAMTTACLLLWVQDYRDAIFIAR
ncbi:hypothetical protein [Paenibacillus bovis]|uniref:hypothetical protein n=1 Tax=Paenibacillus bovis TaxID=1616788 RepID=UPI000A7DED6B|nr:hypothetical protein [Paenibacillus bovis]